MVLMMTSERGASGSPLKIINNEFLQRVLSKDLSRPHVTVTNSSVKRSENASGFASDMYFIEIEYIQDEDPKTVKSAPLLMKCLPTTSGNLKFYRETSAFLREITALSITLPKIYNILESKCLGMFETFSPEIYYSQLTPEPIVIMENLKSYKMPSQYKGLDLNTCVRVMKIVARLHAASVVLYENDPQSMEVFLKPFYFETPSAVQNWSKVFVGLSRAFATEAEKWPEFGPEVSRKLHKFSDKLMENQEKLLAPNENGFNVLNHTDLWTNNMLFRHSPVDDTVEQIRFVDYPNMHFTSPVVDLHFFLITCPSYDIRLSCDDFLLEEYYNELSKVFKLLQYKGKWPTLSELKDEFDQKRGLSLYVAVTDLSLFLSESHFELDTIINMGSKPINLYESKLYRKMMRKLLPFFLSKGVL